MKVVDVSEDHKDLFCLCLIERSFVDGKNIQKGPPPSYDTIRELIAKRVARLRN